MYEVILLLRMTLTPYAVFGMPSLSWDCWERLATSPSTAGEQRKNGVLPCGGIFLILPWCRHGRIAQKSHLNNWTRGTPLHTNIKATFVTFLYSKLYWHMWHAFCEELLHWNERSSWLRIARFSLVVPRSSHSNRLPCKRHMFLGGLVRSGRKAQLIELLATRSLCSFTNHPNGSYLLCGNFGHHIPHLSHLGFSQNRASPKLPAYHPPILPIKIKLI